MQLMKFLEGMFSGTKNFLDCIANNKKKAVISKKEQFDLMSVCFAAEDSIKKNKKIKIKYI